MSGGVRPPPTEEGEGGRALDPNRPDKRKTLEYAAVELSPTNGKSGTGTESSEDARRFIRFECTQLPFDAELDQFLVPENPVAVENASQMSKRLEVSSSPPEEDRQKLLTVYGENRIAIEIPNLCVFIGNEFLTSLYIWQYHCLMWLAMYYYWFVAGFYYVLTFTTGAFKAHRVRKANLEMRDLANTVTDVKL